MQDGRAGKREIGHGQLECGKPRFEMKRADDVVGLCEVVAIQYLLAEVGTDRAAMVGDEGNPHKELATQYLVFFLKAPMSEIM